jgi:hypothetical protein
MPRHGRLVATIGRPRHLEAAIEHSDTLLDRVRSEARPCRPGRPGREAEEGERRRLARAARLRPAPRGDELQLSRIRPDQRTAATDDCVAISEDAADVRASRGPRPPLDEVGPGRRCRR